MKKWMPPEFFFDLIEKGIAERVYQVLIKGPWDGIKQMKIKLTEKQKSQFLDDNEHGYALAWYEKERLLYKLFEKQVFVEEYRKKVSMFIPWFQRNIK
jgi:hypothetical protein